MASSTVFVVDDDPGIRNSVALLLESANFKSACFASADDFLVACEPHPDGCLILDVRMPGLSGPQLQDELIRRKIDLPIIFLTGFAETAMVVEGVHKGAIDFLEKPIDGALLLQRVESALEINRLHREAVAASALFQARLLTLTQREREVLVLALSGMVNKTIAKELAISLRTIEGYRMQIYLKLGVSSLLELAQQAASVNMSLTDLASTFDTKPIHVRAG
jgi:FixJ family two-component response regulator